MATSVEEWLELESDPGLFTMLLENIGVKGVQVEDVYDLTEEIKEEVFGFVFLFKWRDESKKNKRSQSAVNNSSSEYNKSSIVANNDSKNIVYESDPDKLSQIYFAHQIIPNSCATNALLSVLMNCSERITLGSILSRFRDTTIGMSPEKRGFALGSMPELADAHNKRARYLRSECQNNNYHNVTASLNTPATRNMFNENDPEADETYHFVSYVQIGDGLYELDGLQPYPIKHGNIDVSNWTKPCLNIIRNRMCQKSEHFSLMAVVRDRRKVLAEQLTVLNKNRSILQQALFQMDQDSDNSQLKRDIMGAVAVNSSDNNVEEKRMNEESQKNGTNNNNNNNNNNGSDGNIVDVSGNVSDGSMNATNTKRRTSNRVSLRNQRKMDMMKKNLEHQSVSTDESRSSDATTAGNTVIVKNEERLHEPLPCSSSPLDILKPISIDINTLDQVSSSDNLTATTTNSSSSGKLHHNHHHRSSIPATSASKYPTRSSTKRDTIASNSLAFSRSPTVVTATASNQHNNNNNNNHHQWHDELVATATVGADFKFPSFSPDQLRHLLQVVDDTIRNCKSKMSDEIEKRNKYVTDDIRRSFNYDDFIHTFLFALKKQGLLEQLLEQQQHQQQQHQHSLKSKRQGAAYRSSSTCKRIKMMATGGQEGASKRGAKHRK